MQIRKAKGASGLGASITPIEAFGSANLNGAGEGATRILRHSLRPYPLVPAYNSRLELEEASSCVGAER